MSEGQSLGHVRNGHLSGKSVEGAASLRCVRVTMRGRAYGRREDGSRAQKRPWGRRVSRDCPGCCEVVNFPRRLRSLRVLRATHADAWTVRVALRCLLPDDDTLPPRDRRTQTVAVGGNALAERSLRTALQQSPPANRPPVWEPFLRPRSARRAALAGRLPLRLRQSRRGRPLREGGGVAVVGRPVLGGALTGGASFSAMSEGLSLGHGLKGRWRGELRAGSAARG